MKAIPFDYVRPTSLSEAIAELGERGEDARPLAGGQSLVPLLAMRLARPSCLVDLNRIAELQSFEPGRGGLRAGAMARLSALERMPSLAEAIPLMAAGVSSVGHFQIRNRSTVGGCLAHSDPAAELPALLLLLEGRVRVASRSGTREIPAAELIQGPFVTSLAPDELLLEAFYPFQPGSGWGFAEAARREGDYAMVGAASYQPPGGAPRVVVFGAGGAPQRLPRTESTAAAGAPAAEIAALAADEIEAVSDIQASAQYRRLVGGRLVARVLDQARRGGTG